MHCPVCRADNDQGPHCRRCRVDLSLLFRLEEQRRQALGRARDELARGRTEEALAFLDRAEALRRDGDVRRLRAITHLLRRDFARAWQTSELGSRLRLGIGR